VEELLAQRFGGTQPRLCAMKSKELKMDPYTTNPVLAAKLDEVAGVTFSARPGINTITAVLVPGSMAISGTSFTNKLVWDTPNGELLRLKGVPSLTASLQRQPKDRSPEARCRTHDQRQER
jgi:hypothetical protein